MNFDVVISVGHRFYPFLEFIEAFCQKQITISSCFWCLQLSTTIFHHDLAGTLFKKYKGSDCLVSKRMLNKNSSSKKVSQ